MTISFSPIGPWPVVAAGGAAVMGLTIWAYRIRLRGTTGRWRHVALGLRLAAVLLALLAALRPSLVRSEKKKQAASILVLLDRSRSMIIGDEVRGETRWATALKSVEVARAAIKSLPPTVDAKYYQFDSTLRDHKAGDASPPEGRETAIGSALLEAVKRQAGKRIALVILLSDGAGNAGTPALAAAQRLKAQQMPVAAIGFGSNVSDTSKDLAVRDLTAGPTVFVKNQLQVRGTIGVRGFPDQPIEVELHVEGETNPVARRTIRPPANATTVAVSGLTYTPQTPGEKLVTLKVKPKAGELVTTNNDVSTFLTVLKGGLNVLYVQGPSPVWEPKFLTRALDASPDIQETLKVLRRPADASGGELADSEFAPLKYDVYILGDLPANHLTRVQRKLLADAVEKEGAGLIMLGGQSSFGAGGWANTDLARVLPVDINPGDGEIEPEGGIRVIPNATGLENYVLQLNPSRAESLRIWESLPPIPGANRLGTAKPAALVLAQTPDRQPLLVGSEVGRGRSLAFGGETWIWARATDEGRLAHQKFWRQAVLWLAHKEDQGENKVKVTLDRRRLAVGEKVDITVVARDAKNQPIPDVKPEVNVAPEPRQGVPEEVEVFTRAGEGRGSYTATGKPGEYRVSVKATRDGKEIGRDTARFLVYQDDRELENPAADLASLRQIAEATSGEYLAPEQLARYLKSLNVDEFTEYTSLTEHRIWDNWPFLLTFIALLTAEWFIRKRHGWV